MEQIHKRLTSEQVKLFLEAYCRGIFDRSVIEDELGISKTRFFALLKLYRRDPDNFSVAYERATPTRLPASVEEGIKKELNLDRGLIEDPTLPITTYNYSAMRDRLIKLGVPVSLSTIINRAKDSGCYQPHSKKKAHDREVITTATGALIQHDASHHRWSPYARGKWVLITSLDDFSRKLLYADFFAEETAWAHIQAAGVLMRDYGIPLRYYVDSLRVFRFVQSRDSFWRKHVLETDEADPQWKQAMKVMGVDVTYALSPQAKGKIERPYRWLQDRIVRTCALEKLTTIDEARAALREELDRYNNRQVHSTTGEIPAVRFDKAKRDRNTLFRPFALPKPYASPEDVFCLRETRMVNGYRRITLFNHEIEVPKVPLRETVELHLVPDTFKGTLEIRIWSHEKMVHTVTYLLRDFPRVHF